jgi:DNA-binding FrmR family transcriptional regulator
MTHPQKPALVRRLKIIEGQIRGIREMIERDVYCIDIITQASAIKQGISNVEDKLLEQHLGHCLVNQIKAGKSAKATEEIIKVYRLKRK